MLRRLRRVCLSRKIFNQGEKSPATKAIFKSEHWGIVGRWLGGNCPIKKRDSSGAQRKKDAVIRKKCNGNSPEVPLKGGRRVQAGTVTGGQKETLTAGKGKSQWQAKPHVGEKTLGRRIKKGPGFGIEV